ncbi:MAG: hypothetical protein ACRDHN_19945 [Thermomicrobiales bacterium]
MMMRFSGSRRDPLIFATIVAVALILVGTLWLISRNSDSAGVASNVDNVDPVPYTSSEVCNNWATYWTTESGVDVPATALEAMSNCRQIADGTWIVPANAADPRIDRPVVLTDAERAQVQTLENQIQSSIQRFQMLESADLVTAISTVYVPEVSGVDGHLKDGQGISTARKLYTDELAVFLASPGNEALVAYTQWVVANRQAAFAQLTSNCNVEKFDYLQAACNGTGDSLSVNFVPWSWDLSDSLLLDTYLRAVIDGTAPPPPGFTAYG